MSGADTPTLVRRMYYGGRKGRSAARRLRARRRARGFYVRWVASPYSELIIPVSAYCAGPIDKTPIVIDQVCERIGGGEGS